MSFLSALEGFVTGFDEAHTDIMNKQREEDLAIEAELIRALREDARTHSERTRAQEIMLQQAHRIHALTNVGDVGAIFGLLEAGVPSARAIEMIRENPRIFIEMDGRGARTSGPTGASAVGGGGDYYSRLMGAESSGNVAARNDRSSATGLFQFIDSTWNNLMRNNPDLGLTPEGRFDPEQQRRAVVRFTEQNAQQLTAAGIPLTDANLYAAHFLGAGGATTVLRQPNSTPLSSVVSRQVMEANPYLNGMTVGDFRSWAQRRIGAGTPYADAAPTQTPSQPAGQTTPTSYADGSTPPQPQVGATATVNRAVNLSEPMLLATFGVNGSRAQVRMPDGQIVTDISSRQTNSGIELFTSDGQPIGIASGTGQPIRPIEGGQPPAVNPQATAVPDPVDEQMQGAFPDPSAIAQPQVQPQQQFQPQPNVPPASVRNYAQAQMPAQPQMPQTGLERFRQGFQRQFGMDTESRQQRIDQRVGSVRSALGLDGSGQSGFVAPQTNFRLNVGGGEVDISRAIGQNVEWIDQFIRYHDAPDTPNLTPQQRETLAEMRAVKEEEERHTLLRTYTDQITDSPRSAVAQIAIAREAGAPETVVQSLENIARAMQDDAWTPPANDEEAQRRYDAEMRRPGGPRESELMLIRPFLNLRASGGMNGVPVRAIIIPNGETRGENRDVRMAYDPNTQQTTYYDMRTNQPIDPSKFTVIPMTDEIRRAERELLANNDIQQLETRLSESHAALSQISTMGYTLAQILERDERVTTAGGRIARVLDDFGRDITSILDLLVNSTSGGRGSLSEADAVAILRAEGVLGRDQTLDDLAASFNVEELLRNAEGASRGQESSIRALANNVRAYEAIIVAGAFRMAAGEGQTGRNVSNLFFREFRDIIQNARTEEQVHSRIQSQILRLQMDARRDQQLLVGNRLVQNFERDYRYMPVSTVTMDDIRAADPRVDTALSYFEAPFQRSGPRIETGGGRTGGSSSANDVILYNRNRATFDTAIRHMASITDEGQRRSYLDSLASDIGADRGTVERIIGMYGGGSPAPQEPAQTQPQEFIYVPGVGIRPRQ